MCTGCAAPQWSEKDKVLVFEPGHTYARGLTKTLMAAFTPEFSATVALQGVIHIKAKKRGRHEGNRTDHHLDRWANQGDQPPPGQDPKFDYIRQVLQDQRWLPVASQCAVGCQHLRLATKVDLLVTDLQGRLRLVEIKCGFDDYFDVANQGYMNHPWQHVPASFRNKAFLQLLLTQYLFQHSQHRWRGQPYAGAYLLHVFEADDCGTLQHTLDPLPAWCFDPPEALPITLTLLEHNRTQTQHQRRRIVTNGFRRARYRYQKNPASSLKERAPSFASSADPCTEPKAGRATEKTG